MVDGLWSGRGGGDLVVDDEDSSYMAMTPKVTNHLPPALSTRTQRLKLLGTPSRKALLLTVMLQRFSLKISSTPPRPPRLASTS